MSSCKECTSNQLISISTYKRFWNLCNECGSGYPTQKNFYLFQFLPFKALQKLKIGASDMYDYFVQDAHINYSKSEAANFVKKYVDTNLIILKDKEILDISGGNGIFLSELVKLGASGTLTEINEPAMQYAKSELNLSVINFDLNKDKIGDLVEKKFDYIFLRACLMFCEDVNSLLADLKKLLKKDGKIFVQYAVYPTIGTLIRTQIDEFSYHRLRSPKVMQELFLNANFKVEFFEDEIDPSPYVYESDRSLLWMTLNYLYTIPAIIKLKNSNRDVFRARSRNRANFILSI